MTLKQTVLKRVARFAAGGTPSVSEPDYWSDDEGTPWVAIGDMTSQPSVRRTERRVTAQGIASKRLPVGREGTVLFAMYASVGTVSVLGTAASWNQAILGMEPIPTLADRRFLVYWLLSLRPRLEEHFRSNTQDNLNAEQVGNLPYPVLPVGKQRAIADFLDAETARIDALIAKKRRLSRLLNEQFASHVERVIWREVRNTTPLMHLTPPSRQIMYGIVLPGPDVEDGIPIVKGGNVASRKLQPHQLARTTREIEASYARARLAAGDVLYAIRGGIGDVAIAPPSIAGANITQDVARVAPRAGVDSRWIRYALESATARADALGRVVGATVKGINIRDLKRVRLPSVDPAAMRAQANELSSIERSSIDIQQRLNQQTQLLSEHRQALIAAAVTGEIGVSGPRRGRSQTVG